MGIRLTKSGGGNDGEARSRWEERMDLITSSEDCSERPRLERGDIRKRLCSRSR